VWRERSLDLKRKNNLAEVDFVGKGHVSGSRRLLKAAPSMWPFFKTPVFQGFLSALKGTLFESVPDELTLAPHECLQDCLVCLWLVRHRQRTAAFNLSLTWHEWLALTALIVSFFWGQLGHLGERYSVNHCDQGSLVCWQKRGSQEGSGFVSGWWHPGDCPGFLLFMPMRNYRSRWGEFCYKTSLPSNGGIHARPNAVAQVV